MISGTLFVIEEWDDERRDWFPADDPGIFDDEEPARAEAKQWQDAEHQAARDEGRPTTYRTRVAKYVREGGAGK